MTVIYEFSRAQRDIYDCFNSTQTKTNTEPCRKIDALSTLSVIKYIARINAQQRLQTFTNCHYIPGSNISKQWENTQNRDGKTWFSL